jgi:hypothetical protein
MQLYERMTNRISLAKKLTFGIFPVPKRFRLKESLDVLLCQGFCMPEAVKLTTTT